MSASGLPVIRLIVDGARRNKITDVSGADNEIAGAG